MKKLIVLLTVLVFVVSAVTVYAAVQGSKHDFTTATGPDATIANASLCGTCHIPHGGALTGDAPLWAKNLAALGPYTTYNSSGTGATLSGTAVGAPGTMSLVCLSCHDGTVGIQTITKNSVTYNIGAVTAGTYVNAAGTINATVGANGYSPLIGTDLTNDHPVGLVYDSANATLAGLNSTVNATTDRVVDIYPLFGGGDGVGTTECASCHDPHDTTNVPFLRAPIANVCGDCHSGK
ncbi:MAG: cytochrome c3 family protein [Nitrospirota bacterium]|nr:MAG: cytochrome c3 family protein [Nitrospirota bacterium]